MENSFILKKPIYSKKYIYNPSKKIYNMQKNWKNVKLAYNISSNNNTTKNNAIKNNTTKNNTSRFGNLIRFKKYNGPLIFNNSPKFNNDNFFHLQNLICNLFEKKLENVWKNNMNVFFQNTPSINIKIALIDLSKNSYNNTTYDSIYLQNFIKQFQTDNDVQLFVNIHIKYAILKYFQKKYYGNVNFYYRNNNSISINDDDFYKKFILELSINF